MLSRLRKGCSIPNQPVDFSSVDESLRLLKTSTDEISQVAASAAKTLQKRLRDYEDRIDSMVDYVNDIVFVLDINNEIQCCNSNFMQFVSRTRDNIINKNITDILVDFPSISEVNKYLQSNSEYKSIFRVDYRLTIYTMNSDFFCFIKEVTPTF